MARYNVTVEYTQRRVVGVWAQNEMAAEAKAEDIVAGWDAVTEPECVDVKLAPYAEAARDADGKARINRGRHIPADLPRGWTYAEGSE